MHYKTFAIIVGIATLALAILCNSFFKDWSFINSDGIGYYVYLPAVVIEKDITLQKSVATIATKRGIDQYTDNEFFGMRQTTDNNWINKYPVGLALVELPFFFLADSLTQLTGGMRDGLSSYYQWAISLAGLVFLQVGMYFSYKVLYRRFGHTLSLILLTFLLLGTNIIHYSVYEPSMSHIYSFALVSMTLFLLDKYLEQKTFKWIIAMGLTISLIGLIRNLNLLFAFVPLFVIYRNSDITKRRVIMQKTLATWFVILSVFFIPQLIYWQISTGSITSLGYFNESFNFLQPQLLNILFSVYNGLFFWHPLLLLVFPGFYYWWKSGEDKSLSKSISIFLIVLVYILSSWWAWWFGYAFGMRPFIDFYILFLIPIGYLFVRLKKLKPRLIVIVSIIVVLFFTLNMIQMNNYWRGIVAGHNISLETYLKNFANPHLRELIDRFNN